MKNNNNNLKFATYLKDNGIQEMVKIGFVRYVCRLTDTSLMAPLSTTRFNTKNSRSAVMRFLQINSDYFLLKLCLI
jgi:hypothetical protein